MIKNSSGNYICFQLLSATDGSDAPSGLSPVVNGKSDGGTWGPGTGTIAYEGAGMYSYAVPAGEINSQHTAFQMVAAGYITVTINVYPVDPALFKADTSNLIQKATRYRYTNNLSGTGFDEVTIGDPP